MATRRKPKQKPKTNKSKKKKKSKKEEDDEPEGGDLAAWEVEFGYYLLLMHSARII